MGENPKDSMLTHHISSQTFDGISYQHHQHNLSHFELGQTPITQALLSNTNDLLPKTQAKDKKLQRRLVSDRTHTPPPPTTVGRMQSQMSNEKSMQNSSSFVSKKQTAYVNPKNPSDDSAAYKGLKTTTGVPVGNKMSLKLNNFMKSTGKP